MHSAGYESVFPNKLDSEFSTLIGDGSELSVVYHDIIYTKYN